MEDNLIPKWVKGIFVIWIDDQIKDDEFLEALTFLIDNEIIKIPGYGKINILEEEIKIMNLSVDMDKELYHQDNIIEISGTVPNNNSDTVTIMIIDPKGLIMTLQQVSSTNDGTFTKTFLTENLSNLSNGMYKVTVQYGSEKVETSFNYSID